MLKNNNQKVISKISSRSMKHNKARNLFAIIAIVLTTFMFTSVFSIAFSLAHNMSIMALRWQGTRSSIYLEHPTKEQYEQVKKTEYLNAVGKVIKVASATASDEKYFYTLMYYDQTELEKNFLPAVSDLHGKYPQKQNEIMLSRDGLEALGIKAPEKGMDITLTVNGENMKFSLSGWIKDYGFSTNGFSGFVSEVFTKEQGMTLEQNGMLSISSKPGKQMELQNELDQKVKLAKGQKFTSNYDVQEENNDNNLVIIILVAVIGGIIILSGYLLIYNIMYISVTKDIQFYGMLKTIGASPSQIQKIVKKQAVKISAVGIPLGILLGTMSAFIVVPYALGMFGAGANMDSVMPSNISFNPFIYIGTILFGIITVGISCRKPAKLAGKVSPIEAMKYNGFKNQKCREKKTTNGGKLYRMAFRNVFREKKRAILVFASLFMGTMAFLSANTFTGSMKVQNYVDYYLPYDYVIYMGDSEQSENAESDKNVKTAPYKLAEEIKAIDGVTRVDVNRTTSVELIFDEKTFRPFMENEKENTPIQDQVKHYKKAVGTKDAYTSPVISVSSEMMKKYNEKARQKIDIDRFEKGEVCLAGFVKSKKQSEEMLGNKIKIKNTETGKIVEQEVGACPLREEETGLEIGYFWNLLGAPECILISDKAMDKLADSPEVNNIIAQCNPKRESLVTVKIKELVKTTPGVLQTDIKSEQIRDFKTAMTSMNILSSGISFVLILIGIINFVNVMLTGVFTRRRELAVMESVGMTKKQVQKMLMFEGFFYGLISIGLIMTMGNVIIYFVADAASRIANYAVFHYPVLVMLIIVVVIMAICIIVPAIVYKAVTKETVTERLKTIE